MCRRGRAVGHRRYSTAEQGLEERNEKRTITPSKRVSGSISRQVRVG